MFVAVEGPTGVGKTTLAGRFAVELGAVAVFDPFEVNPFLPALLATGRPDTQLALRVELTFVALRVAQLRHIADVLAAGRTVVADWALVKQPIFAATTLDPADTARIAATVNVWAPSLPHPDVLIGLSAPTALLVQRIRDRGRPTEVGANAAGLDALSAAFEAAYAAWPGRLIRRHAPTFDSFRPAHLHELATQIRPPTTIEEQR